MSERIYYSDEARKRAQRDGLLIVAVFTALGLSIGTVLAMLFAPQSGQETRREISSAVEKQVKSGRSTTEKAVKKLEERVERLGKMVEDRVKS